MPIKLCLIAAACENMGIGNKGDLPWRLRQEMAYFTRMTQTTKNPDKKNAVIMGRKTWDSIPPKYKPLEKRINIVLSRNSLDLNYPDTLSFTSWEKVMNALNAESIPNVEQVWVIGGSHIYKLAMESQYCHRIYLTRILQKFECDAFFPEINTSKFNLVTDPSVPEEEQEEKGIKYRFEVYEKIEPFEA